MQIATTFEILDKRHPEAIGGLMQVARLKNPKWKKKITPSDASWAYDFCIKILAPTDPEPRTLENRLKNTQTRIIAWNGQSKIQAIVQNPPEVVEWVTKQWNKQQEEKARLARMTPEQKKAEAQAIIATLRHLGSFSH